MNLPADMHPGALRHSNMIFLAAAASTVALVTLAAPAPLALADNETERDAVLLECCDLPDKQLTLTEADLDGIVSRFTADVPIKLQHIDSPLDPFGAVKSVWRSGRQLLGKIAFPPAIAALVRERGAAALSCGLDRSPLNLAEVSLVIKGRIPAATLLADDERAELDRLRAETTRQKVDAQIVQLKLAGKVIPATEAAARVLLGAGDASKVVLTDGSSLSVSEAFAAYLAAQPPLITLGELAQLAAPAGAHATGDGATGDAATLSADQKEWLSKSLGVDPAKVEETMKRDQAKSMAGAKGGR